MKRTAARLLRRLAERLAPTPPLKIIGTDEGAAAIIAAIRKHQRRRGQEPTV